MILYSHTKNQENPWYKFFKKLEKPHFGNFWPKNFRARFFSKNRVTSLFRFDGTLTARKKIRKFLQALLEENSEQTKEQADEETETSTNARRIFHMTFTFWVQKV